MRVLPDKFFAAMIAVGPLPGSPRYAGSSRAAINAALSDLEQYLEHGADVIVLENSHEYSLH
jgi:predicted TIM-barrel enzyme